MPNSRDPRDNPAWQAAQQWRERTRQGRPSGLRLFFTWLLFGTLMIVGTVIGLFFLLIGWAMLPFMRHRMKKRMERMRAEQAEDIGGGQGPRHHSQQVLEGDYVVKDEPDTRRPD
ncbi:hypothetical protein IEI94_12800 [Halomonas sp. ML-15]|uniref:hypothetical protein n=1 Tax=Halomonas sp. ML-15 TaxID=2773305 RepID=UPI00174630E8|nr:hypothetical protein [Halomonas sp. ML-15]MBD3896731.1 hypothetical protein [Halomonas sp. ML-15]